MPLSANKNLERGAINLEGMLQHPPKSTLDLYSFFTEVGSQIVVSGELNNGREAGPDGGQEVYEKCQRKVNK